MRAARRAQSGPEDRETLSAYETGLGARTISWALLVKDDLGARQDTLFTQPLLCKRAPRSTPPRERIHEKKARFARRNHEYPTPCLVFTNPSPAGEHR